MNEQIINFDILVDTIYNLPLQDRLELRELLTHNIQDANRAEIKLNIDAARTEHEANKLIFSSDVSMLKKML